MRRTGLLIGVMLIILSGCGASDLPAVTDANAASPVARSSRPAAPGSGLTVFAAASLTDAFTVIGQRFDQAHASRTIFNFAASQQLAQQIIQGAPADVFASANATQMQHVIEAGMVISGTQQAFVRNRLVVIYPADNPANITGLADLARPGVKLVLAAEAVPVGQYALDFLRKASESPQYSSAYSESVLANVVSYGENVRAVLSKVELGEADAGIVYTSDITPAAANAVGQLDIPDEFNTIASYSIALIDGAAHPELAQQFIDYVLSAEGQQILEDFGFMQVTP